MTDHARKAAEEIVDALGLPHDHGTEEESDFAAIISRAIADSERELVEALEKIAGPVECVLTNDGWCDDNGNPLTEEEGAVRVRLHRRHCKKCIARAALAKRGRK